jgi:hypothetical protein
MDLHGFRGKNQVQIDYVTILFPFYKNGSRTQKAMPGIPIPYQFCYLFAWYWEGVGRCPTSNKNC